MLETSSPHTTSQEEMEFDISFIAEFHCKIRSNDRDRAIEIAYDMVSKQHPVWHIIDHEKKLAQGSPGLKT